MAVTPNDAPTSRERVRRCAKRFGRSVLVAALLSCGSSNKNAVNFTGAWTITQTSTVVCGGGIPSTGSGKTTVTFTASGPTGLQSEEGPYGAVFIVGCGPREWALQGDTATLQSGPDVGCAAPIEPGAFFVYTSYTATTSDGQHLTMSAAGNDVTDAGSGCSFEIVGTGTR